ncbi:MAG: VOC family protein, partial [Deltaproteobacteria bacterium]|nr:VOC family protein [Deltaproteobacteria bacterium]
PEGAAAPEAGFRALFFHLEGGSVELLAFERELAGVDPRVCRPAPGGVQHVAFRVGDLDGALAAFERSGGRILEGFPRQGFHGRIAFLEHPDIPGLVELIGG